MNRARHACRPPRPRDPATPRPTLCSADSSSPASASASRITPASSAITSSAGAVPGVGRRACAEHLAARAHDGGLHLRAAHVDAAAHRGHADSALVTAPPSERSPASTSSPMCRRSARRPRSAEHVEIAARLRRLDDAERVPVPGDLDVDHVVAGDLQEHTGVGTALVGLAGGVQEPRPEPDDTSRRACGRARWRGSRRAPARAPASAGCRRAARRSRPPARGRGARPAAHRGSCGCRARRRCARPRTPPGRPPRGSARPAAARPSARTRPSARASSPSRPRRPAGRTGLTPSSAPATAVANSHTKNCPPRSRRSCRSMRTTGCPAASSASSAASCCGIGLGGEPQVREQPVLAVGGGLTQRLRVDRDHALSVLAGRLGKQLLQPGTEVRDPRRCDERQLVAPRQRRHTEHGAEQQAWVLRGRGPGAAGTSPRAARARASRRRPRRPRRRAPCRSSTAPSSGRRSSRARAAPRESRRRGPPARAPSPGR